MFLRIEDFNFTDVFYVWKTLTSLMFFLRIEDFNFTDVFLRIEDFNFTNVFFFTYGRL